MRRDLQEQGRASEETEEPAWSAVLAVRAGQQEEEPEIAVPISRENLHHYKTPEWKAAREAVMARSGNRCEVCGVANGSAIMRHPDDGEIYVVLIDDVWHRGNTGEAIRLSEVPDVFEKVVKVVLTCSHTDHDPSNNDPRNIRALCQRCHNRHDAPHRAANRRRTRDSRKGIGLSL